MSQSLEDEFSAILKSLDSLSEDKIQLFTARIAHLFKKIYFNSEHGTEQEKKEAFEFAAKLPKSFNQLQTKLDKNPAIDGSQFKNLFAFIEGDVQSLKERSAASSIHLKKVDSKTRKKKVIKKV